jgi:hypothetical protein
MATAGNDTTTNLENNEFRRGGFWLHHQRYDESKQRGGAGDDRFAVKTNKLGNSFYNGPSPVFPLEWQWFRGLFACGSE